MNTDDIKFFIKNGYFNKPQLLQVEITDFCPLNCPQCYKQSGNYSYIKVEDFFNIATQAKSIGVEHIFLNGGEPLTHKHFIDIVKICDDLNISCTVFISGIGVDNSFCQKIKDTNLSIYVSLNGSNQSVNKLSRDGFNYAIKAMNCLKRNSVRFGVNWVARHDNIMDFEKLILLSRNMGANNINIVCNKLTAKKYSSEFCTYEDYKILRDIINKNRDIVRVQLCYDLLLSFLNWNKKNNLFGCPAGIRLMAIDVHGNYVPCSHLYYKEQFGSLIEYWRDSKVLKRIRNSNSRTYCDECNKCRVCLCISKDSYQDFGIGFKECPLKNSN